jgi:hypothetical protein
VICEECVDKCENEIYVLLWLKVLLHCESMAW